MMRDENKKRIRYDLILIVTLLLVGIFATLVFFAVKKFGKGAGEGAVVVVEIDRKRVAEYPLYEDGVYVLNGGTNTLTVKDGEAWMSQANCPGYQDCIEYGKINGTGLGQMIVCSPNRVHVYIEEK